MIDCPSPLATLQQAFALGLVAGAGILFWFGYYLGMIRKGTPHEAMD